MGSKSLKINKEELKHQLRNIFIFSLPAVLAFLIALQSNGDYKFALGAGYSAFLSALIGLIKTYLQDNSAKKS